MIGQPEPDSDALRLLAAGGPGPAVQLSRHPRLGHHGSDIRGSDRPGSVSLRVPASAPATAAMPAAKNAFWLLALHCLTVTDCVTTTLHTRQSVSLDGTWQFSLYAPSASSDAGGELGPVVQTGTIQVPGSWEAQGYGNETVQMYHQVLTGDNAKGARGAVGVYTLSAKIPPCDDSQAKRVLTVDRGIHRHGIFKVAGRVVGEHMGYLTPFEAELEASTVEDCCCGSSCDIEVTLDGGRNPAIDPLMGAVDDDTDGTNLGGWAGLNGHVAIECRPPIYIDGGVANVIPPHVTHPRQYTHPLPKFIINIQNPSFLM